MPYTNFIGSGVSVNGAPLIPGGGTIPLGPNYWFVNSVSGSNGYPGTADQPFATLAFALTQATAAIGDVIILQEGHAETISAAGGIAVNKSGVSIIGLGNGNNRPTFTFGTSTAATMTITAANVTIANIVGTNTLDQIVSPFVISGAQCTFGNFSAGPVTWIDSASNVEAVRAVLTTATADNLSMNLQYIGQTGGTHCVNAVRLVGCDGGKLNVDFYGKASTAWVEFLTTACTNIEVYGYMYNSGTTNYTKDVVDTVTGSTWFGSFFDGAAGFAISGGSGSALGPAAAATVIADLGVPTQNSTANLLERDVIGNKTDASVYAPNNTTASVMAIQSGLADLQEKVAVSATATMVNGNTIFTIAGGAIKIEALYSICVTNNDATASTLQYQSVPTVGSATTISGASSSLANATAGATVTLAGTALATAALYNASGPNLIANPGTILAPAGTLKIVIAAGSTTGTWKHVIRYKPLQTGVTVS